MGRRTMIITTTTTKRRIPHGTRRRRDETSLPLSARQLRRMPARLAAMLQPGRRQRWRATLSR